MFKRLARSGIIRGGARIPGVRALPLVKLIALGEIALLARSHISRLNPAERRRFIDLLRKGRARNAQNLTSHERDELASLIGKAEPRLFAGLALDRLSPVPLPRRVVQGRRKH